MSRGRRAAIICGHTLGMANLMLLTFGDPTTLAVSLAAVVLAPFTLGSVLSLTALFACASIGFTLADRRERTELLVCVIGGLQPPIEGEKYREAMLAEIRAAPSHLVQAIRMNLIQTAPRIILGAWVHFPTGLRKRARTQRGVRAERPRAPQIATQRPERAARPAAIPHR